MNSAFKVLHAGIYPDIGELIGILAGQEESGTIKTEWYYFIKDNKKPKGVMRKIKSGLFASIEEFWKVETETNLLQTIFYHELGPLFEHYKEDLFFRDLYLKEVDPKVLFSLKASNKGFIQFIEKHTECPKLREYLKTLAKGKIDRGPITTEEFKN